MKISWIKYEKDNRSFRLPQALGFDVLSLSDLEKTDETMKNLIKQDYDTIIISDEVASFSEDIIKKYKNNKNIKIVISLNKS